MQVVCISETAKADGNFTWLDFANSSNRLDVIARCAQTILRERVYLPILTRASFILTNSNPQKTLDLHLKDINNEGENNEYKIAQDLKELLTGNRNENKNRFFQLQNGNLKKYLEQQESPGHLLLLEEEGQPIQEFTGNLLSSTIIIGDQNGFSEKTLEIVKKHQGNSISLGKNSYLSSHSLFLILYETLKRTKE
jgi:tRNA pseudouridine-54 N-methylase